MKLFPGRHETVGHVEAGKTKVVFGNVDLHVLTGFKINGLVVVKLNHQFFDKSGNIFIGNHGAVVFFDTENVLGNMNAHVLTDFQLAGQPDMVQFFLAGKMAQFGGLDIAAAGVDPASALAAGAAAAAGGRQKYVVV